MMMMTDLLMFWSQTNSLTDGLTTKVVKLLSQLKKITVMLNKTKSLKSCKRGELKLKR